MAGTRNVIPPFKESRACYVTAALSDEVVVRNAVEAEFTEGHMISLVAWFRRETRDTAVSKDLAQECALIVIRKCRLGQVRQPDRLGAFVYGVARKVLARHRRDRRAFERAYVDVDELESPAVPTQLHVDESAVAEVIWAGLNRLGARDRELLRRRYVLDEDSRVLAQHFEMSETALKVALHRARKKLKHVLVTAPDLRSELGECLVRLS